LGNWISERREQNSNIIKIVAVVGMILGNNSMKNEDWKGKLIKF